MAAKSAFDGLAIPGVGGEAWRVMWEAARRYSEEVAYPAAPFPPATDESCVLCHQALSPGAKARLGSFEDFIKADAEAQATAAEREFSSAVTAFKGRKLDVRLFTQARRRIGVQHPALARSILRFVASADLRRLKCLKALAATDALVLPHSPRRRSRNLNSWKKSSWPTPPVNRRAKLTPDRRPILTP